MASSQVIRGPDSGGAGEASAPPASCEATLTAAPALPGDPSVSGDLVLPGIALEPVVVTLLDPAVAGVKEDPVVEKVERVGIALATSADERGAGQHADAGTVERIIRAAPGLVVVDEAYYAFADRSFLPRVREFANLIAVTFSDGSCRVSMHLMESAPRRNYLR